ncbi:NUDIX hydrolase [Pseudomaricurvus sp.]|uniref:NUDIX hydrolase n=1 Tax=Pseudomaricurvus sp. TaxID=2004510 RepID=UPI003F6C0238
MSQNLGNNLKTAIFPTLALAGLLALTACTDISEPVAPACPANPTNLTNQPAKSAGCLSIDQGKLLVVQGLNGKVSIPGGSGNPQEPAHCTAHRETWEETGLSTNPTRLIRVFDNGFHLFECEADSHAPLPKPPFYLEIKQALWLRSDDFDQFQWRFPEQKDWLKQQLLKSAPAPD